MKWDFEQQTWTPQLQQDLKHLIQLAIHEDSGTLGDLTSQALIPPAVRGEASVVAREQGVAAGLAAAETILTLVDPLLSWEKTCDDGTPIERGQCLGKIVGPVLSMLTAERLLLNLVGRLSGVATLTRRFVEEIAGTSARIYDTRKTTLGWRRLEKYAVRCGGGHNHRSGLYDAILIKDNHLAFGNSTDFSPAQAVQRAKNYLLEREKQAKENQTRENDIAAVSTCETMTSNRLSHRPLIEIEVDSLEQLAMVLPEFPDIVLLDNMPPAQLRQAVEMRNRQKEIAASQKNSAISSSEPSSCDAGSAPFWTELEASGGINLRTVRAVAETGVDRISAGALTHSAITLDVGLDW